MSEKRTAPLQGREDQKANDLFFTCSLIDYIGRKTKNRRSDVVKKLGKDLIRKIYDLADVYHSDNIERVCDDFVTEAQIDEGTFDNVADCTYQIPSHWDIGKVYKRLIIEVAKEEKQDVIDVLYDVYTSFISEKIDDYNSSMYYENTSYLAACYLEKEILE